MNNRPEKQKIFGDGKKASKNLIFPLSHKANLGRIAPFKSFCERILQKTLNCFSSKKPIVVATTASEAFVKPLAAMLRSLLENYPGGSPLKIIILEDDISDDSKTKIQKSLSDIHGIHYSLDWINVAACKIRGLKLTYHFTEHIYFRLLLPQLLPEHFKKIIYLDADLIVLKNIKALWRAKIGSNYLQAVPEVHRNGHSCLAQFGLDLCKRFAIDPTARIFNSGVLLIDLKKWRRDHIADQIVRFIQEHHEHISYPDQDGINVICNRKIGELDLRWNQNSHIFYDPDLADFLSSNRIFKKKKIEQMIHAPYIVHFNCDIKPWLGGCQRPYTELFFHYLGKTLWHNWRPSPGDN